MAKSQAILFLREWYMHPNGQLPAYEFALDDVNPPVHAWACWRIYKMTGSRGQRDRVFLERALQKLLLNFTWWVNCEDHSGKNLFAGGFLGFDNISLFDRSTPPPPGVTYAQADGTAWMAFYCLTMLAMSLELALENPAYEDIASKFFEHFVAIADAMNNFRGTGLWDEEDGFYYDGVDICGQSQPVRARSMVGLVTLFAVEVLEDDVIDRLPGFKQRMNWFLKYRPDLGHQIAYAVRGEDGGQGTPAAGNPVATAAGARAAIRVRRARIPLALRHPRLCPPCTASTLLSCTPPMATFAPSTLPENPPPRSSAAIPTGVGLSGFP